MSSFMLSLRGKTVLFFILLSHLCFGGDTLRDPSLKYSTHYFTVNQFEHFYSLTAIDNSLEGFQNYLLRNHLGNSGSAYNDLTYQSFSKKTGFRYAVNNYRNYFYTKENLLFFDSGSPYTDLFYIIGSKREQDFRMTFSYNVKKNWNVAANFFRIRSEGYYLNQNTNNNFISLSTNYRSKNGRYTILMGVMYNYVQNSENGGISDDSIFENTINIDKKLLDVNLTSARGSSLNRNVFFNQYFYFGKKVNDTSSHSTIPHPRSRVGLSTSYDDNILKYSDAKPLSGFYSNIYYDSVLTKDSAYNFNIENELSWKRLDDGQHRGGVDKIGIEISALHQLIKVRQREIDTASQNIILGTTLYNTYSDHSLWYSLSGKYCVTGLNIGDYSVIGRIKKNIVDSLSYFKIEASSKLQMPDFIYNKYSSNHYNWDNAFKQVAENKVAASFTVVKYNFSFGASISEFEMPVYFDNYMTPRQYKGTIPVFSAFLKKNFKFFNWHLNNNIQYQNVPDSTVIRLPDFILEHSLFYENDVFKGAMRLQIGVSVFYVSEYYANAYSPATAQFYLQDEKKFGNYPFVDFFINARVKAVRVFFKIDHLNSGISGNRYVLTPNYPYNDRAFKLGISWRFYD